jgi:hypothetical protein
MILGLSPRNDFDANGRIAEVLGCYLFLRDYRTNKEFAAVGSPSHDVEWRIGHVRYKYSALVVWQFG